MWKQKLKIFWKKTGENLTELKEKIINKSASKLKSPAHLIIITKKIKKAIHVCTAHIYFSV